ncbi:MAG: tryptophan-rich sensory protein [Saprospiraceae bacterium]|nr:tryptophan-rich sensory protein [Candidatus Vicinibacter affinis]MBK7800880.1 tryptophan-rich sensory protein [Candidatus Vicinibacter affinis]
MIEIFVLWICIVCILFLFYKIKPMAAYIYIPYLLWGTFVQYLIEAIISSTELDFITENIIT